MDSLDAMRSLVDQLNEASRHYYVLDKPIISDKEWDRLYDELRALEEEVGTRLPDSPTRRVGAEPLPAFRQHRHKSRLWSMDKVQSKEALAQWFERIRATHAKTPGLPPLSFVVEYKYDGLTLVLTYDQGLLVTAATRGNGRVGEEVLPQAMAISAVPLSIPFKGFMEIHGECFMPLSVLAKYNETSAEPLKNARNAAAGGLRSLDPEVTRQRRLQARFYDVPTLENPPYSDQSGMHRFIAKNGFPTSPMLYSGSDESAIENAVRLIEEGRENLDFLIDGAVIKVSNLETRRALGYTDKFPRWAVAFKFAAEEATATLLSVTWDPGRSGKLTPLGHLNPVELAGVTVQKATLNNYGDIQRKQLTLGATVWVRRSNDVIPEILGHVEGSVTGTAIDKPTHCPACGTQLEEIGAHLFCLNRDGCKPQIVARLTHYASKGALDIDQLSGKTVEALYERLGVNEPQDLYALTLDQLLTLPGFKEKRAQKLLAGIDASRTPSLDAFLVGIGIPNIGQVTARDLANSFGSLSALRRAGLEELTAIPSVGEIVGTSVLDFFADAQNSAMVDALLAAGVTPREANPREAEGALSGQTLVLTGSLPHLSRQQAEEIIQRHGGVVSSSVSRKTSFILLGEKPGSKLQKAQALGVPTLDETAFLTLVGEDCPG
ncbi:MAG: NAD-dependent DNA ligase LigA [Eubacteriales bacterium]|nr:NAD-dependent DNA ligase LigA [Eubacteriales bacterium]